MRVNEFIKEDHGPTVAGEWWEIIKDKLGIGDGDNHQKYLDNYKKQPDKIPPPKRKSTKRRRRRTVVPGMHGTEDGSWTGRIPKDGSWTGRIPKDRRAVRKGRISD